MLSYTPIEEAWRRSPLPVRGVYPQDEMVHTEPIAQISGDLPQTMTGPQSGAEYVRLPAAASPAPAPRRVDGEEGEEAAERAAAPDRAPSPPAPYAENDTAMYDVILFGIAGVVLVLMLEQFVQMGIALQPRHR